MGSYEGGGGRSEVRVDGESPEVGRDGGVVGEGEKSVALVEVLWSGGGGMTAQGGEEEEDGGDE